MNITAVAWRGGSGLAMVRLLTPAEMARLQGFPANFKLDEKSLTRSRLVVGNALPPPLAFNIMRAAMKTL